MHPAVAVAVLRQKAVVVPRHRAVAVLLPHPAVVVPRHRAVAVLLPQKAVVVPRHPAVAVVVPPVLWSSTTQSLLDESIVVLQHMSQTCCLAHVCLSERPQSISPGASAVHLALQRKEAGPRLLPWFPERKRDTRSGTIIATNQRRSGKTSRHEVHESSAYFLIGHPLT